MATLPTAPLNWAAPRYYDQPSPFALAHFRLDGEILEPANLAEIRLPETLVRQRNHGVVFSGRGPLWLYGHLVHLAHAFAWVGVYDPRLSGAVVVMRHTSSAPPLGQVIACAPYEDVTPRAGDAATPPSGAAPQLRWQPARTESGLELHTLELTNRGEAFLPSCLADAALPLPLPRAADGMAVYVLSGHFPQWLAARLLLLLAEEAAEAALALYQPSLAAAVVVRPDQQGQLQPGTTIPDRPRGRPVPVLALVGDPNSGKSVLSWKLYRQWHRDGAQAYRLDCDAQAPTAPWGMDSETGTQLRKRYKDERGPWRSEDVQNLVAAVKHLQRSSLDLVLLDMPGGIHPKRPGDGPAVRIPDDRQALFHLADGFVILWRDEAALEGWRTALAQLGLHDRILAEIAPCPDDSQPERIPRGLHQSDGADGWCIHQLDRDAAWINTPAVAALAAALRAQLATPSG